MLEYSAQLVRVLSGGSLDLDINLGLNNVRILSKVFLDGITVDSTESERGLAAKQKLSDLLDKANGEEFRIKARQDKDGIHVVIYIGGMNVNKTLTKEGYVSGEGH